MDPTLSPLYNNDGRWRESTIRSSEIASNIKFFRTPPSSGDTLKFITINLYVGASMRFASNFKCVTFNGNWISFVAFLISFHDGVFIFYMPLFLSDCPSISFWCICWAFAFSHSPLPFKSNCISGTGRRQWVAYFDYHILKYEDICRFTVRYLSCMYVRFAVNFWLVSKHSVGKNSLYSGICCYCRRPRCDKQMCKISSWHFYIMQRLGGVWAG